MEGLSPFEVLIKGPRFYLVSLSSGQYLTQKYGINLLWSRALEGPYLPLLNKAKIDLKDFGPARGSFFQDPLHRWWVLFHAADRRRTREIPPDSHEWSSQLSVRNLFLASVEFNLNPNGEPTLTIFNAHGRPTGRGL